MKNNLENLELKLLQRRRENAEKLDKIETEFKGEFGDFFDVLFKNDNLGFNRFVSVYFQLEKLENPSKNSNDILKNSINKALAILPVNKNKKELLEEKILKLNNNKDKISELFLNNSDLHKNYNFPILEGLKNHNILNDNDLIKVSLKFKETKIFLDSISVLSSEKIELIKSNYFHLNDTKKEDRIKDFKSDFSEEISNSNNINIYPKVFKFIGKNYFKLKLKNKVESKKERLRRIFKIAFLKLYRLKFSGLDISSILNNIDSLDDLDSMINLLLKFFEQLKQNPNLAKDYIISDDIDDILEVSVEAEENKEKILFSEKNTIKANEIFEEYDKKLNKDELENLLGEDVDLVGEEFINRNSPHLACPLRERDLIDEDDEELEEEIDLEEYYEELKVEYENLEKKKIKLFLDGNYDDLDLINGELVNLLLKLEKLEKILEKNYGYLN